MHPVSVNTLATDGLLFSCPALVSVIRVQSFNTNCVVGQSFYEQEFIIVEELGHTLISEIPVGQTKQIPKF